MKKLYSKAVDYSCPFSLQHFLFMKFTIIFLFIFSSQSFALDSKAQERIDLVLKNSSLVQIFQKIEAQTSYRFVFGEEIANDKTRIDIEAQNSTLSKLMQKILPHAHITYTLSEGNLVAVLKKKPQAITGKVTDPNGDLLVGVSVQEKGTGNTTLTDSLGEFRIEVVNESAILVFTHVGFLMKEVKVNSFNMIVRMEEDISRMDDVVVVGFGTQKKTSVVGAISTISPKDLRIPTSTLSNAFAGRLAGVVAVQRSGAPGADGANFWIRGISTFAGSTNPLIFIDGVEAAINDLNALAPEVIDGFSVLKDATATALYGARGANGVMLITTRKGKNMDAPRLNFRLENSVTQPTQVMELANGVDYMNGFNEAILTRNATASPRFSQEYIDNVKNGSNPVVYPNIDWMKYLFKDVSTTQVGNLNITGGGQRVTYFMSASANHDNGMFKSDPLNKFDNNINQWRYNFIANINSNITKTTKAALRINSLLLNYKGSAASVATIYGQLFEAPPTLFQPVIEGYKGEDHILFGNLNGGPQPLPGGGNIYRNPYATMVSGYSNRNESTTTTSFEVNQDLKFITPGLRATGLFSFRNWSLTNVVRSFTPFYYAAAPNLNNPDTPYVYAPINTGTTALGTSTGTDGDRTFNTQVTVDYSKSFGKHDVSGTLIYFQREYNVNAPGNFYATEKRNNIKH